MDGERRLEKWAPPGWKSSATTAMRTNSSSTLMFSSSSSLGIATVQRSASSLASIAASFNGSTDYCLHLRFRYYPKKIEFVK